MRKWAGEARAEAHARDDRLQELGVVTVGSIASLRLDDALVTRFVAMPTAWRGVVETYALAYAGTALTAAR